MQWLIKGATVSYMCATVSICAQTLTGSEATDTGGFGAAEGLVALVDYNGVAFLASLVGSGACELEYH